MAWKNHIDVGAGVIDSDYRGTVKVVLFNCDKDQTFAIKKGDRIAQLILEVIAKDVVIEECDELPSSKRGKGGFGSTGTGLIEEGKQVLGDAETVIDTSIYTNTPITTVTLA